MDDMSNEARRITFRAEYSIPHWDEVRGLLSELFGYEVPESLRVFPPFYADFGKNINNQLKGVHQCLSFSGSWRRIIGDGWWDITWSLPHSITVGKPEERHTTYPASCPLCWVERMDRFQCTTIRRRNHRRQCGSSGPGSCNKRFGSKYGSSWCSPQFIKSIVL